MTAAEKKERRDLKHDLQRAVRRNHFSKALKLRMTTNQLKQYSRQVADRLLAGRNPHESVSTGCNCTMGHHGECRSSRVA